MDKPDLQECKEIVQEIMERHYERGKTLASVRINEIKKVQHDPGMTGSLVRLLISDADTDIKSWEALQQLSVMALQDKECVNDLAMWAFEVAAGKRHRPTQKRCEQELIRDRAIMHCLAVLVHEKGCPIVRKNEAEKNEDGEIYSASDIVADVFIVGYEKVRKMWGRRDKKDKNEYMDYHHINPNHYGAPTYEN